MLSRSFVSTSRVLQFPLLLRSVQSRACISLVVRFSSSNSPFRDKLFFRKESSSPPKKDIPNLKWRDIMCLIDLPENRNQGFFKRIGGIKNQILKLGGMNVVVFTTVVYLGVWAGLYVLLKNGLLPMDSLVDLLGKTAYTSKAIVLVQKYPNFSYLIISNMASDLFDPFRYILTFFYARHIINKRYLETALETISHQDQSAKDAVASVKRTSLKDEESKNPKIKSTRIITIKGKNNSSINL